MSIVVLKLPDVKRTQKRDPENVDIVRVKHFNVGDQSTSL